MPDQARPNTCKSCRCDVPDGASRCEPCAAERRKAEAAQRAERREKGRCLTCGKRAAKGRSYCATHLEYYRERAATK